MENRVVVYLIYRFSLAQARGKRGGLLQLQNQSSSRMLLLVAVAGSMMITILRVGNTLSYTISFCDGIGLSFFERSIVLGIKSWAMLVLAHYYYFSFLPHKYTYANTRTLPRSTAKPLEIF